MSRFLTLSAVFMIAIASVRANDTHGVRTWPSPFTNQSPLPATTLHDGDAVMDIATLGHDAPVILVRYLGFGCTHCVEQLTYLNDHADDLKRLGIDVVAFSEDDAWTNSRLIRRMGYDANVLRIVSDPDNAVARELQAVRMVDDTLRDLHLSMVIRDGRVVFSAYTEQPYMDVERLVAIAVEEADTAPVTMALDADAPHVLDKYLSGNLTITTVAGPADGINAPVDLDFNQSPLHPTDLWVVTTDDRGYGIAILHEATDAARRTLRLKKDSRASHFMWRTQAIAMGSNGTFSTMQNGQNGNMDPFYQFMGPTLWSADTAVFASRYQEDRRVLASHLDMLHQSPIGLGIAHDHDNVYWVTDGYYETVHRYDFHDPHEVGGTDHRDGRIRRYTDATITLGERGRPGHVAFDDEHQWLYIVDPGSNRVIRFDTKTGSEQRRLVPPDESNENLASFTEWSGATVEELITEGLGEPVGIAVDANRLFIGDRVSGTIHVYGINEDGVVPKGTIATGAQELLGICIGPDQRIWFVDRKAGTINRLDTEVEPSMLALNDVVAVSTTDTVQFQYFVPGGDGGDAEALVAITPTTADGDGTTDTLELPITFSVTPNTPVIIDVPFTLTDTLTAWRIELIENNGTATGGVRAHTIVVPRNIKKVVADDALMETFRITEAVSMTDRENYVSLRSDVFVRVADQLDSLQIVLWNGGTNGEISVTDDAVLRSLIEREVEVFLIADDPLLLRADLPGSITFFSDFGTSLKGAEEVAGDTGQRLFNGIPGDSVSGGLSKIDCQLPRLDHFRGGDFVPNVLFRDNGVGIPVLLRDGTDEIGAVRNETGYRRSIIMGINAARFLDGFQRTQLLDQGLAWLEAAPVEEEPVDTTVSVAETYGSETDLAVEIMGNPATTSTTIVLVGTTAHTDLEIFSVTGQRLLDVYHGPVNGRLAIPVDVSTLASGTLFVIARDERGVSHRTFVKR